MNELFIILPVVAIISIALIIYLVRNAQEIKQEPKEVHQVRKMTFVVSETEKPKRKKKKYYNKKKKPVVAESAPTEKRPVGRPRKTVE
jgi:uncharacterized protein YoxC